MFIALGVECLLHSVAENILHTRDALSYLPGGYTFTPGIVYLPPFPHFLQVQTPLGVFAELLRAGHVRAAAASALVLLPPLLSAPGEEIELRATLLTDSHVLQDNLAFRCAVVCLLRLIASVLAGAAVSCFGSGDWVRHARLSRDSRTRLWLSKGSDNPKEAQVSLGAGDRVSNIGRRLGNGEGEGMGAGSALASPSWFVPSGALGAAFYTVSMEGGFGGFFREFIFGEAILSKIVRQRFVIRETPYLFYSLNPIYKLKR